MKIIQKKIEKNAGYMQKLPEKVATTKYIHSTEGKK